MTIIIQDDLVLSSDITYTDNIQVANGVTLTVENGVTVDLGGYELLNYGTLELKGSESKFAAIKNGTYSNENTSGVFTTSFGRIESLTVDGFFNNGRLSFESTVIIDSNIDAYNNTYINSSLFQNSPFTASGTASSVVVEQTTFKDSLVGIDAWFGEYQGSVSFTESNFINKNTAIYLDPFFSGGSGDSEFFHNISLTNVYISTESESTFEDKVFDSDDDLRINTDITSTDLLNHPYTNSPDGFVVGGYTLALLDLGVDASGNTFLGTIGNDSIVGFSGYTLIDGGDGIDTAVYASNRADFVIQIDNESNVIIDNTATSETEALTSVERLQFTDTNIAFDIEGNAGTTAKVLGVTFGAESVSNAQFVGVGLGLMDGGMDYETLMGFAISAAGARTNEAVVDLLWENVVGSLPNDYWSDFFVERLDNGKYTPGSFGVLAAELDLNATNIDLVGLAQTGIEFV